MPLRIIALLGAACLVAAAYFYVDAVRDESLNLQPLSLPLSLAPGTIRTPEFKTDIDRWNYDVAVDFDTRIEGHRIECLIGGQADPNRCQGIANLIDISWEILGPEGIVSQGNSRNRSGLLSMSGFLYERTIGSFRAKKGHSYTLVLHVNHDASELNTANPRVVVQIPIGLWEDHAIGIFCGKLIAAALGLFGIALLLSAFIFSKLKKRGSLPD